MILLGTSKEPSSVEKYLLGLQITMVGEGYGGVLDNCSRAVESRAPCMQDASLIQQLLGIMKAILADSAGCIGQEVLHRVFSTSLLDPSLLSSIPDYQCRESSLRRIFLPVGMHIVILE